MSLRKVFTTLIIACFIFSMFSTLSQEVFAQVCTPGDCGPCIGSCHCDNPNGCVASGWCCNVTGYCQWQTGIEQYCCDDTGGWGLGCCGTGCFTGGVEIEGQNKAISELEPGEIVSSFDPETGEIREGIVSDVQKLTREGYYELETESGKKVKVTSEHPFLAVENESFIAKLKEIFSHTLTYQLITGFQTKIAEVMK